MRSKELATFIKAREAARLGTGRDPIIALYRFCNVVRADDRTTRDIFDWAQQWAGHEDLWFAFVVARLFNNRPTLDVISKYVLPFKPAGMGAALAKRKATGVKLFNAAYIVSTNGRAMDKVEYVIIHVLQPLWAARKAMRPKLMTAGNVQAKDKAMRYETLDSLHAKLQTAQGLGSFMAAQVIADLKYFPPFFDANLSIPTSAASDWWTFAASGPGSRRGLNRVMGQPVDAPWREPKWRETLSLLHRSLLPLLPASIGTRLSAQDVQNCLCEFDKYQRALLGEGVPKQLYKPFDATKA